MLQRESGTPLADISPFRDAFPLGDATKINPDGIYQGIWGWKDCSLCTNGGRCPSIACPWKRRRKVEPFIEFYKAVTFWSSPERYVITQYIFGSLHYNIARCGRSETGAAVDCSIISEESSVHA